SGRTRTSRGRTARAASSTRPRRSAGRWRTGAVRPRRPRPRRGSAPRCGRAGGGDAPDLGPEPETPMPVNPVRTRLHDLDDTSGLAPTKGNVLVGNGTAWVALGVGANGFVVTADPAQPTGVKWAAPAGGGGTPGGASGQLQYNNAGNFAGASFSAVAGAGNLI